jgi:predicted DNA-binding protein (MmcQ/YjbR family)
MDIEEIRAYCLTCPGTTESFPFDEVTLVFKVMGKIFCMISLDADAELNLKNTPGINLELREHYPFVNPGYHMNKKHWNTIKYPQASGELLKKLISESYDIVVNGLTKKAKEELKLIRDDRI